MSYRSEQLAKRIEEGAAGLATFVAGLSDAEWSIPVSATDRRSLGVVAHHVASMYPIEIEIALAIAAGNPVTDVTPEVVNQINARHAAEYAQASKADTLDLLRRNSQAAADTVRALTDEQLDRAAQFSLAFGAPITTQFVIEDHPLRHSWHHLAQIKRALGDKARSVSG